MGAALLQRLWLSLCEISLLVPQQCQVPLCLTRGRVLSRAASAWHAAGLAHGGSTCEEPPGVREGAAGKLYLAYLRDPDGNKICALHRMG